MSFFTKVADVAHRGVVLVLMSVTVYQAWQIGKNTIGEGRNRTTAPNPTRAYLKVLDEKVKEDYKKDDETSDHIARGWYHDEDDKSFEQEQREFKKKIEEATRKAS
jgi:hypothetical protein